MVNRIALMSIATKHARKIFDGTKLWEFRKVPPRLADGESLEIFVYSSRVEKAIAGSFHAGRILRCSLTELMAETGYANDAEAAAWFAAYYQGARQCCAIEVCHPVRFRSLLPLQAIQARVPSFRPPQNFIYITQDSELYSCISERKGV